LKLEFLGFDGFYLALSLGLTGVFIFLDLELEGLDSLD